MARLNIRTHNSGLVGDSFNRTNSNEVMTPVGCW